MKGFWSNFFFSLKLNYEGSNRERGKQFSTNLSLSVKIHCVFVTNYELVLAILEEIEMS